MLSAMQQYLRSSFPLCCHSSPEAAPPRSQLYSVVTCDCIEFLVDFKQTYALNTVL